jgi:hypothetical protein
MVLFDDFDLYSSVINLSYLIANGSRKIEINDLINWFVLIDVFGCISLVC